MLVGLVERLAVGLAYWLGRRVRRRLRNLGEAFHRTNISQWPRQDNLQRFFWRPGAPAPDRPAAWVRRWGNKIEHPIIRSPTIETTRKPGIAKQIPAMDSRAIWCVRRRHQNTPVSVMTPITNIGTVRGDGGCPGDRGDKEPGRQGCLMTVIAVITHTSRCPASDIPCLDGAIMATTPIAGYPASHVLRLILARPDHRQWQSARADRRVGELLGQFKHPGARADQPRGSCPPRLTQRQAASDAGLSKDQEKTAVRVAKVPDDQFEAAVEGDEPMTVDATTELAEEVHRDRAAVASASVRKHHPCFSGITLIRPDTIRSSTWADVIPFSPNSSILKPIRLNLLRNAFC